MPLAHTKEQVGLYLFKQKLMDAPGLNGAHSVLRALTAIHLPSDKLPEPSQSLILFG